MTFLLAISNILIPLALLVIMYLLILMATRTRKQSRSYNVTKKVDKAEEEIKDYLLDLDECERRIS
jgi:uncharacterized membrane protein